MRTQHEVKKALAKAGVEVTEVNNVLTFTVCQKTVTIGQSWAVVAGTTISREELVSRIVFSSPAKVAPGKKSNIGNPRAKGATGVKCGAFDPKSKSHAKKVRKMSRR